MSTFPSGLFDSKVDDISLATLQGKDTDDATYDHATVHREDAGEIIALETKIGTGSSQQTPADKYILAGDGAGTSLWETDITLNSLSLDTTLAVTTNTTIGGTLAVTGNTSLNGTGNTLASADFTGATRISNNTKHRFENSSNALDAAIWEDTNDDLIIDSTNEIKFQTNNEADIVSMDDILGGWIPIQETFTFSSDDDPTYVVTVSSDVTSRFKAGTRIKLTDSGTQYFVVSKDSTEAAGTTTITMYGGTSHAQGALSGGAITGVYYSYAKCPPGFSIDPDDWTEEATDSTDNNQANPVASTWYNLGGSLDIPIGRWRVDYKAPTYLFDAVATQNIIAELLVTLSTANNSESDKNFTSIGRSRYYISATSTTFEQTLSAWDNIELSTKDTYYLNISTTTANISEIQMLGSSMFPTKITAVSTLI